MLRTLSISIAGLLAFFCISGSGGLIRGKTCDRYRIYGVLPCFMLALEKSTRVRPGGTARVTTTTGLGHACSLRSRSALAQNRALAFAATGSFVVPFAWILPVLLGDAVGRLVLM
jgi:hypothetical protein